MTLKGFIPVVAVMQKLNQFDYSNRKHLNI